MSAAAPAPAAVSTATSATAPTRGGQRKPRRQARPAANDAPMMAPVSCMGASQSVRPTLASAASVASAIATPRGSRSPAWDVGAAASE